MKNEFFDKVKALFSDIKFEGEEETKSEKFLDLKTEDGRVFRIDGEELVTEISIKEIVEPEEGDETGESGIIDVEDGEYTLEDGRVITVESGLIKSIKESEGDSSSDSEPSSDSEMNKLRVISKMTINTENMAVIKETYVWEIEVVNTEFKVGDVVKMTYEEDGEVEEYTVYAATYELEDGRFITTNADGVIILITDKDGNVLESPSVDDNLNPTGEDSQPSDEMSAVIMDAFKIVKGELDEIKKEFKLLEEKYNKIAKLPSGKFEKATASFKQESDKKSRDDRFSNSPIRKMFGYN